MSDFGPTNTHEALSRLAKLSATSEPSVAGSSSGAGAAPPPLPAFSPNWSAPVPTPKHARRPKVRRALANRRRGRVGAAALRYVRRSGFPSAWPRLPRRQPRNSQPPVPRVPGHPTLGRRRPKVEQPARSPVCPTRASR